MTTSITFYSRVLLAVAPGYHHRLLYSWLLNLDQNQIFYYPDPSPGCLVLNTQVAPFPLSILEERFPIQPMENEDEESREVHALAPVSSR